MLEPLERGESHLRFPIEASEESVDIASVVRDLFGDRHCCCCCCCCCCYRHCRHCRCHCPCCCRRRRCCCSCCCTAAAVAVTVTGALTACCHDSLATPAAQSPSPSMVPPSLSMVPLSPCSWRLRDWPFKGRYSDGGGKGSDSCDICRPDICESEGWDAAWTLGTRT